MNQGMLGFGQSPPSGVQSAQVQILATGGTIPTAGVTIARVAPAGAVTGVILQPGTYTGQEIWIVNESTGANSVTFAVVATSYVADGASSALVGLTARKLIWDSAAALWFRAA